MCGSLVNIRLMNEQCALSKAIKGMSSKSKSDFEPFLQRLSREILYAFDK